MNFSSKILENAVMALSTLPGIGKKTALRLALHLVQDNNQKATKIANSLQQLQTSLCTCKKCHNISDSDICQICANSTRLKKVICVVESARDVMAIEDTNQFNGRYHVLGGLISPLEGIGPDQLSIQSLVGRVEDENIEELIMALSPTIEGETTIYYISKMLANTTIKLSIIARGISFGGDLEYADELTLGRSIVSRLPYQAHS